ncbi:MAG: kelch repeat-containing protein [bacterium]|nr:kelch repeat-containing protein [bacterium]
MELLTILIFIGFSGLVFADSWSTKVNMSTARDALGVAVVAGKIYAIGGNSSGEHIATNEKYNQATNSWATKTPMPTPRYGPAVSVVNDKIYAIGGWNGSNYLRLEVNNKIITKKLVLVK